MRIFANDNPQPVGCGFFYSFHVFTAAFVFSKISNRFETLGDM